MTVDLRAKASLDSEGRVRQSLEPRKDGSSLVKVTQNLCDKTTWWYSSERIEGQLMADEGDGLIFGSGIANWIDLTHGKVYREDLISAGKTPVVYDNGVAKTERAPFATTGGDFIINYATGEVTFFSAPTGPVTADFNRENGSLWVLAPDEGKKIWVEDSEVQFSADVSINDTVHFQAWAYNPQDFPNKVPVTAKTTYKTAGDYVDEARGVYPSIDAFGGTARGLQHATYTFPFKYLQLKELFYSMGLEIRVWLENDVAFGGERGTATFYCTSLDENA